jgi:hypothetical protein
VCIKPRIACSQHFLAYLALEKLTVSDFGTCAFTGLVVSVVSKAMPDDWRCLLPKADRLARPNTHLLLYLTGCKDCQPSVSTQLTENVQERQLSVAQADGRRCAMKACCGGAVGKMFLASFSVDPSPGRQTACATTFPVAEDFA